MDSSSTHPTAAGSPSQPDGACAVLLKSPGAGALDQRLPLLRVPGREEALLQRVPASTFGRRTLRVDRRGVGAAEPWPAHALRDRWKLYRQRLAECREGPSAESVHDLRVACRRLIAQLILAGGIVPGRKAQRARRMLKRQLRSLSTLRDYHVQQIFFAKQTARFPEAMVLLQHIEQREREFLEHAFRRISRFKTRKLEKCVCGLVSDLRQEFHDAGRRGKLTALALHRAGEAFADTVERRRLIDPSEPRTIHRTRVVFKTFRYIVESIPLEVTGFSKRDLRNVAHYQRRMGNLQDLEVIQATVADFIRRHTGLEFFLAPLGAYLRGRRRRALRSFCKAADQLFAFWPPPGSAGVRGCVG